MSPGLGVYIHALLHQIFTSAIFDRLFYAKVRSIPLEHLENPEYHNTLARARQLVFGQTHTNVFWSLRNVQTLVANLFGCLGILWFFSAIHWGIAAIVLLDSGFVLKWRAQNSRVVTNVVWGKGNSAAAP